MSKVTFQYPSSQTPCTTQNPRLLETLILNVILQAIGPHIQIFSGKTLLFCLFTFPSKCFASRENFSPLSSSYVHHVAHSFVPCSSQHLYQKHRTSLHGIVADFVETKQAKFIQAIEQATPDALSVTIIDVTQV